MTKEKPEQFDEVMDVTFRWKEAQVTPNNWTHIEFLGTYQNYYLYWVWDYKKEDGVLYKTKIEKCK